MNGNKYVGSHVIAWAMGIIIVAVSWISVWNAMRLINSTEERTETYLTDVAIQMATQISQKGLRLSDKVSQTAEMLAFIPDREDREACLKQQLQGSEFQKFAIVGEDGQALFTDGSRMDVSGYPGFQAAWQGRRENYDFDGREGAVYAAPIDGKIGVEAVLVGIKEQETMHTLLAEESFRGESICFVIDQRGELVIPPLEKVYFSEVDSILNENTPEMAALLEKMELDVKNRRTGNIKFQASDGEAILMNYTPLSVYGWYVMTLIPEKILYDEVATYVTQNLTITGVSIVLFAVLLMFILLIQRKDDKRLEKQVFTEPLTGGMSNVRFQLSARERIDDRPHGYYALVSLDISKFKVLNDLYGSQVGNEALLNLYRILKEHFDKEGLVSRDRADVFYLLIKNTGKGAMIREFTQVQRELNESIKSRSISHTLELKAGICVAKPSNGDLYSLQDRANMAKWGLDRDKTKKSICGFFDQVKRDRQAEELELLDLMDNSLKNGEFQVYLQPKVSSRDQKAVGAEALIRWKNPVRGFIYPNEFIPVFEKNGRLPKLDTYVFEEVCRILDRWKREGRELIQVSINLSRQHLMKKGFLREFTEILERYQVKPEYIELEITESSMLSDFSSAQAIIEKIHEVGFHCSLDDFGSGYSTLGTLRNLEVDALKLDRSFFVEEGYGTKGKYVVETVVNLARKLNIRTVAEGIETGEQVEFLREIHCDMIQGYIYSKPVPVTEFEQLAYEGNDLKRIGESA